jgi:hypothetical protein
MQQVQNSGYLQGELKGKMRLYFGRDQFVLRRIKRARDTIGTVGIILNELWTQTRNCVPVAQSGARHLSV